MFDSNSEEKKLDWMYKGANSTVDREEYLLGRPIDKTLEQLNEEEKQKQHGVIAATKHRVEHECIPPSIRDVNKVVEAVQVDLSAKLQEDPLVAIKKRMEEARREFLQNPVQLKKLQKALKAQQVQKSKKKKKKSKQRDNSDSESDLKLSGKLKLLKSDLLGKKKKKVVDKEESALDTILIHKFNELKSKLSEKDLQDIMEGNVSDSDSEDDVKAKKPKTESSDDSDDEKKRRQNKHKKRKRGNRSPVKSKRRKRTESSSSSSSDSEEESSHRRSKNYDSDSDSSKNKKRNYGLVSSDGSKIALKRSGDKKEEKREPAKAAELPKPVDRNRAKRLTEEEKEKLRREMMDNAKWRDKERSRNVKKYRELQEKESKREKQQFDSDFAHKQLLKAANSSSVESRIKANLNNIQRSNKDMDRNFSKR